MEGQKNKLSVRQRIFRAFLPILLYVALAESAYAQSQPGSLINPLADTINSIPKFIAGVLKVVVMVALPIIVLFFVYAGFKFLFAQGNAGKLQDARKNLVYAVIGAVLILGAWVIATLIAGTVTQLLK